MNKTILTTNARTIFWVFALLNTAACSSVRYAADRSTMMPVGWDYIDVSTVIDNATSDGSVTQVTDQHVLKFANEVKKFMEIRTNQKGVLRKSSSSLQVISAAFATAFAAFKASAQMIAGFSGFSAVVPELQNVFQAKEGADAFREGSEMVSNAISDYLVATEGGRIPSDTLTDAGKELQKRVLGTIVLVNKALLQLIPSKEEVAEAVDGIEPPGE